MKLPIRTSILACLSLLLTQSLAAQTLLNLGGNTSSDDPGVTMIEFEQTEMDLGEIKAGEMAIAEFKFRNTGEDVLIIDNVKPSCACASLEYTEEPIQPGGEGRIYTEITTDDKSGDQIKYFTVFYNGNPPVERVQLTFHVIPAEGDASGKETGTPEKEEEGHRDGDHAPQTTASPAQSKAPQGAEASAPKD